MSYKAVFKKGAVLGAPPSFHHSADPNQRVFLGAMNPPPVVQIIPGLPNFKGYNQLTDDIKKAVDDYDGLDKDNAKPAQKAIEEIQAKAKKDARFFAFELKSAEYLNSVRAMISRAAARMVGFQGDLGLDLADWGGLLFYLDKSTSITESFSSTWEDSMMKGLADTGGNISRNAQYAMDQMFSSELDSDAQAEIRKQADASIDFLNKREKNSTKELGGSSIGSLIQGDTLMMPKMWSGSETNRSYDLAFRFETPYGDARSILRDVMIPYFCLLPYALGRQVSTNSYTNPFLLRVDSPGWFTVEAGMVTSMTVKRGPNDEDWTETGYARSIEVNLTVEDIFPTMISSSSHLGLESNFQLAQYLDNLSGLDYTQMGSATSTVDTLKGYINNAMMNANSISDVAGAKVSRFVDQFGSFIR